MRNTFKNSYKTISMILALVCLNVSAFGLDQIKSKLLKAYFENNCEQTLPLSTTSINNNLFDGEFWYYKGLCEKQTQDYEQALISFQLALKHRHLYKPAIYFNLGIAEANLGDHDKAMEYFKQSRNMGLRDRELYDRDELNVIRAETEFEEFYSSLAPKLDVVNIFLLLLALTGITVTILLLFRQKSNRKANKWLALLLFLFSLNLVEMVLQWSGFYSNFPYLRLWQESYPYFVGPVFFFYLLTTLKTKKNNLFIYHLIPGFTSILFLLPLYFYFLSGSTSGSSLLFSEFSLFGRRLAFEPWLRVVHLSIYGVLSFFTIWNAAKLNPYYRKWLYAILVSYAGFVLTHLTFALLEDSIRLTNSLTNSLLISQSILIALLSFFTIYQPKIFRGYISKSIKETTPATTSSDKYLKSALTPSASLGLKKELIELMEVKEMYKNNQLNLNDLVEELQSTRHSVSQVINEHFHCNFYDFVNGYRIKDAKEMIVSEKFDHFTFIQIAYQVGFNNKVSFNNAFRKFTGNTPSEYKKKKKTG